MRQMRRRHGTRARGSLLQPESEAALASASGMVRAAGTVRVVDDGQEIWALIDRSNDAWTSGRPTETAALYAEDAVLVTPGLDGEITGRDAIVATYEQFVAQASVERFVVTRRSLTWLGDTAVAAYLFDITYTDGDASHDERGEEILVLRRGGTGWRVRWRTQVSLGPEGP